MAAYEEKTLRKVKKKQSVWWRYIDNIFFGNIVKNLSIKLIYFIQESNLRQIGEKYFLSIF